MGRHIAVVNSKQYVLRTAQWRWEELTHNNKLALTADRHFYLISFSSWSALIYSVDIFEETRNMQYSNFLPIVIASNT